METTFLPRMEAAWRSEDCVGSPLTPNSDTGHIPAPCRSTQSACPLSPTHPIIPCLTWKQRPCLSGANRNIGGCFHYLNMLSVCGNGCPRARLPAEAPHALWLCQAPPNTAHWKSSVALSRCSPASPAFPFPPATAMSAL